MPIVIIPIELLLTGAGLKSVILFYLAPIFGLSVIVGLMFLIQKIRNK